jgi:AcrR family transcriptional regulator
MPARQKKSRNARTLKSKGEATRSALLEAAHQVFKDTGYYGSSISEISRRCGVSMGTFYHYFKNKEQVFLELSGEIVARFKKRAEASPPAGHEFRERLKSVIALLLDHTRDNFAFHRILGESELIDRVTIAFYDSITQYYRDFFNRELQAGNIRSMDIDVVSYGLIGICYFNTLDWGQSGETFTRNHLLDLITDLVLTGIGGPAPWRRPSEAEFMSIPDPVPLHPEKKDPLTKGEKTREALLEAAGKVIGRHGINRASISEITRYAGVAQGTFYIHFKSKNDLVIGFVRYINRS